MLSDDFMCFCIMMACTITVTASQLLKEVIIIFIQNIIEQQKQLNKNIENYKKLIGRFPSGSLQCFKNGKHIQSYKVNGNLKKYIPTKESATIEKLALKKYYESCLDDCIKEKELLDRFIQDVQALPNTSQKLLATDSNYHTFLAKAMIPDAWANTSYEQNPYKHEDLIHNTFSGIKVRSKSEEIIANILFTSHIPFRYEAPLTLNGATIYPDFTIKNSKNNSYTYWEHLGLMDKKEYKDHAMEKISTYCDHNIIPDVNLILTYETQKHPLDSSWVQQLVMRNFM